MSWCPKCKNEYRAGITVCPDCKEELMEELTEEIALEFVPVFNTADDELKSKLVKYLEHCGIQVKEEGCTMINDEGESIITTAVTVPAEDAQEAAMAIRTVLMYDAKLAAGEEDLKPRHRAPEPSTVYVDAKARYQEYKSSGIMFLVFAVFFLVFGILNIAGVIHIMASTASLIIVFGAAVAFTYIGITSLMKISSLKEEASTEETTTEAIMNYLKECYPKEVVETITKSLNSEEELTGEELYFERINEMKEHLIADFPNQDENYLDALLEEYYNSLGL